MQKSFAQNWKYPLLIKKLLVPKKTTKKTKKTTSTGN